MGSHAGGRGGEHGRRRGETGTVVAPRGCEAQKREEKRRRPRGRQPARPRHDNNGEDYIPTVFDKFNPMSRWIGALSTWGLWDTAGKRAEDQLGCLSLGRLACSHKGAFTSCTGFIAPHLRMSCQSRRVKIAPVRKRVRSSWTPRTMRPNLKASFSAYPSKARGDM